MVVHNLYVKSISVPPYETHTILVVHSNAVLSGAVSTKGLQLVPGGTFKLSSASADSKWRVS